MNKKIFWKFFFGQLLIVLFSTLFALFFLKSHLVQYQEIQNQKQMSTVLDMLSRQNIQTPEAFLKSTQGLVERITWIDEDGKVIADNSVPQKDWKNLENHSDRPELQAALAQGSGLSVRYSSTLHKNMMYFTQRTSTGFLRAALPLESLEKDIAQLRKVLGFSFLLGLLCSLALSGIFSSFFSSKIAELQKALSQIALGDFSLNLEVKGQDELARLALSTNELSQKVAHLFERLNAEKTQLQDILDSMLDGVMVIDEKSRIQLVNPPILKILQLETAPLGQTPLEVLRSVALQKLLEKVFCDCLECEDEIILESNPPKYLRVHLSALKSLKGAVIVFHDITHLRQLEQIRKEFVANASHELKTPLSAIKGYTETLLGGAYQDETVSLKFLKIIENHANRLTSIIQDLLDLSKLESSHYQLKIEKINLVPLMEELRSTFTQVLSQKKITLELPEKFSTLLWADLSALRQILSNLIENAIKYSPESSSIKLSLEANDGKLIFCVQDNGTGIAPEHLPRLFERFYRVDASRSREQGGTGLGLSIVKHLVQLHGGRVWVESVYGEGASFFVELPQSGMI